MSYDIKLQYKDGSTAHVSTPFLSRGGTVPAYVDANGHLRQAMQTEASINITYNYGRYYQEAAEDDARFYVDGQNEGIRGIYGKPIHESISMLLHLIRNIEQKHRKDGKWLSAEREKPIYLDKDGNEMDFTWPMPEGYTSKTVKYTVSEGCTDDYWEATAANAIQPLLQMLHMATELMLEDVTWQGD